MVAEPGLQDGLQVGVHEGEPPEALAELVAAVGGSFFQTPAWMRAVCRADEHYRNLCILARGTEARIEAACPLFAVRQWGMVRLYAGSWGTYGGILARSAGAGAAVRRQLERLARSPRVLLVRVHDFSDSMAMCGATDSMWRLTQEDTQVLDLPEDPQTLFQNAFTPKNRNKIRKAEKLGVTVRRAPERSAFETYARLYAASTRRWGVQNGLPASLLYALSEVGAGVDLWVAERAGETLAALLNFSFGAQVMNWGNVSRPDAWQFAPNNLLHWHAIQDACRTTDGPRLYNFGSSSGLPNVRTFKSSFGVRDHAYKRYEVRSRLVSWLRPGKRA